MIEDEEPLLSEIFSAGGYDPFTQTSWDGVKGRQTSNANPDQPRDEHGRFSISKEGKFHVLRDSKYGSENRYKDRKTAEAEQSRRESESSPTSKPVTPSSQPASDILPRGEHAPTEDIASVRSAITRTARDAGGQASLADVHESLGDGWSKPRFGKALAALDGKDGVYLISQEGYGGISERERAAQFTSTDGKMRYGAVMVTNRSFFADCERDEGGHCLPADATGTKVSREEILALHAKVRAKYDAAPKPTKEDRKKAQDGIARKGANKYRRDLVGNTKDRAKRRESLLKEFGDGKSCPCCYCARKLGEGGMPLEQDKLFTTAQGGKYRTSNLVPCCGDCNKSRGDVPFKEIQWPKA